MIRIEPAIVVEGRYDKNKIKQLFDTVVLDTAGFGIFICFFAKHLVCSSFTAPICRGS